MTPLVTYLEGPLTGADIELAVSTVLSPFKRETYCSPTSIPSRIYENGSASESIVGSTDGCATHPELGNHSMDNVEVEEMSGMELTFQLSLTDDKGLNCRPILEDTPVKTGQPVKVMLDWTDKENELYDTNYLKNLPEVRKTGLTMKKTKQEAVSLFSCLDSFLKEEPLGPDDMW